MKKLLIFFISYETPLLTNHSFFQADFKKIDLKGVSYNHLYENVLEEKDNIDILFIPGNGFKPSYKSLLHNIFSTKKEIFLVVEKGNPEVLFHEKKILEYAGRRLQYPVRELDTLAEGELFHILNSLSENFLKKSRRVYQSSLLQYLKNFSFDYQTEAKFQLLNCCKNNELDQLLNSKENSKLKESIEDFIQSPSILEHLYLMKNSKEKNFKHLFQLQKLIFSSNFQRAKNI